VNGPVGAAGFDSRPGPSAAERCSAATRCTRPPPQGRVRHHPRPGGATAGGQPGEGPGGRGKYGHGRRVETARYCRGATHTTHWLHTPRIRSQRGGPRAARVIRGRSGTARSPAVANSGTGSSMVVVKWRAGASGTGALMAGLPAACAFHRVATPGGDRRVCHASSQIGRHRLKGFGPGTTWGNQSRVWFTVTASYRAHLSPTRNLSSGGGFGWHAGALSPTGRDLQALLSHRLRVACRTEHAAVPFTGHRLTHRPSAPPPGLRPVAGLSTAENADYGGPHILCPVGNGVGRGTLSRWTP
jgi:hypothetical protein